MSNKAPGGTRPYKAQSLERDSPRGELGLSEVARGLGLNKSTLHRLLVTLLRHGYVAQDAATKRYRLGLVFLEFAHVVVERLEVRSQALRVMHQLADATGESVYLNVLAGGRALCVDEVVGPRGVTLGSNVDVALPLHAAATGKCFLAWMPAEERDALLGRGTLESVTARTVTDRAVLLAELKQVRQRGYAVNDEETEPGVRYVAVPIFDEQGRVFAALSLGAPVLRLAEADLPGLGAAVVATAARISTALGYRAAIPAAVVGGEAAS